MQLNDFRPGFELVQIVRPCLHHRLTLFQKLRPVVCCAQRIGYAVCQLVFNHFEELENKTVVSSDASYKNDQVILQVTYRME